MSLRPWFPALLVAGILLATLPYGPWLRERIYRLGSPRLLAQTSVPAAVPLAATPARVAVGTSPVLLFRTEDLGSIGRWEPPSPCEALEVDSQGPRCAPHVTGPAGVLSQDEGGGHTVLGLTAGLLVDGVSISLPGPALQVLIQRDVVHVATGETGVQTIRLSTGQTVFSLPGPAVALGGTDRTLVVAGDQMLRVYDMVPGKRRVVPGVAAVLLLAGAGALRRAGRRGPGAVLWLGAITGAVTWKLLALRGIPIEAVHLLEFTAFGALACRALAPGRAPWVAAASAALLSLTLGCLDETLQWWHPSRTGDIRDVWTDTLAGAFGALAAWKALGWTSSGSRPAVFPSLAAIAVLSLAGFQHLVHGFGTLRVHPDHGTWISRGDDVEAARRALQTDGHLDYTPFLRRHGKHRSPSAHEVRGRVYRRDFWLARERLDIVCGEQGILDEAWPGVTERTPFVLAPAEALSCEDIDSSAYASPISGAALTALGPRSLWAGAWGLALLLGVTARRLRAVTPQ